LNYIRVCIPSLNEDARKGPRRFDKLSDRN